MTFVRLRELIGTAPSVFELYLALVKELWIEWPDQARKLLGPSSSHWDGKRAFGRAEDKLATLTRELTSTETDSASYAEYQGELVQLASMATSGADDTPEIVVAVALRLLFRLDGVVGELLATDETSSTYPATPALHGFTIVVRRPAYYPLTDRRIKAADREPGSLRSTLSRILRTTYVVPPLSGDLQIPWQIRRMPDQVEALLLSHGRDHRVLLIALPHRFEDIVCTRSEGKFRVLGLSNEAEEVIVEELSRVLTTQLKTQTWSVIVLPEYAGTSRIRQCVMDAVERFPHRTALVLAGSNRDAESEGPIRNRSRSIGPSGNEDPSLPMHCKLTRFALTASRAPQDLQAEIAQDGGSLIEDIDTEDCGVTFWDSAILRRTAVLICRDLLEQAQQFFLRFHQVDHLFVPAMSPTLDDFSKAGANLAALLGAGLYVANAPLWSVAGSDHRPAALAYRPIRGAEKTAQRWCQPPHRVCAHGFSLAKGWIP